MTAPKPFKAMSEAEGRAMYDGLHHSRRSSGQDIHDAEAGLLELLDGPESQIDEDSSIEQQIEAAEKRARREAWQIFITQMHSMFAFIRAAGTDSGQAMRVTISARAWAYPSLAGKTEWELAAAHGNDGISRANFNKHLGAYQKENGLPKMFSQKSEESSESFRSARKEQLNGRAA